MKLLLLTCLVGLLASNAYSESSSIFDAGTKEPTDREKVEAGILPGTEGESVDVDFDQYQYEKRQDGEMEGDSARDEAYDCEMTDDVGRPPEPKTDELTEICEGGKQGISSEAKESGLDVYSENATCKRLPYPFTYYVESLKPQLKCCLKKWNYGCVHVNDRHPCFVNYYKYSREWCCPLWPRTTVARCICDKCAIMTNHCVHLGRCQKRYTRKSFVAVCYRYGWKYLRFFTRWVPSSCYCRAG